MIVLVARYHVKAGHAEDVANALREITPLVEQHEPGCTLYQANRSTEDPNLFLLYEIYVDEDALAQHRETEHFKRIIEGFVVPLLDKREREFYEPIAT